MKNMTKVYLLVLLVLLQVACIAFNGDERKPSIVDESDKATEVAIHSPTKEIITPEIVKEEMVTPGLSWFVAHGSNPMDPNWNLYHFSEPGTFNIFSAEQKSIQNYSKSLYQGYQYDDGVIYTVTPEGYPIAYDLDSGKEIWISEIAGKLIGTGLDSLYVYTNNNRVYNLDKRSGQEKWKIIIDLLVPADNACEPYPFVGFFAEKQFIPVHCRRPSGLSQEYSLRFLRFDEGTGECAITDTNPLIGLTYPIYYHNGVLFTGRAGGGILYGINVSDGSVKWQWDDSNAFIGGVTASVGFTNFIIDHDQHILYFVSHNQQDQHKLNAVNLMTGELVWGKQLYVTDKDFYNLLVLNISDQLIYVTHYRGDIFVFDRKTGQLLNSEISDRSLYVLPTDRDMILYYSDLGIAQAVNSVTNELYWEDDDFWFNQFFGSYGDLVLLTDANADLIALDVPSGNYLWKVEGSFGDSTRYVFFENKLIYFQKNDSLAWINLSTGENTVISLEGNWANRTNEYIQIVDDKTWILFGTYIGVIKH